MTRRSPRSSFFFFNDTATTEIYTLSLHDALPILEHVAYAGEQVDHEAGAADDRLERGAGPGHGVARLEQHLAFEAHGVGHEVAEARAAADLLREAERRVVPRVRAERPDLVLVGPLGRETGGRERERRRQHHELPHRPLLRACAPRGVDAARHAGSERGRRASCSVRSGSRPRTPGPPSARAPHRAPRDRRAPPPPGPERAAGSSPVRLCCRCSLRSRCGCPGCRAATEPRCRAPYGTRASAPSGPSRRSHLAG